jgi:tetratricopeptide (TPR) repeat protein
MFSSPRVVRALVLGVLLLGSAPGPALAAAATFEHYLSAAVTLYEDLEYERALKQLELARKRARGPAQKGLVSLHRGILLAELGRWPAARAAFRVALRREPHVTLPLKVSPKVEAEFEAVRARVHKQLRIKAPPPAPPSPALPVAEPPRVAQVEPAPAPVPVPVEPVPSPTVAPVAEPVAPPAAVAAATDRPEQERAPVLAPAPVPASPLRAPQVEASRGRPVTVPLVLLGAGAAAAGVGTYFGVASRGQVSAARQSLHQDEALAHLDGARGNARLANILFGTAGLAATGALVTYLLSPGDASPEAEVSP